MKSSLITKLFVLFTVAFDPLLLSSQVNVTTWHNDIGRTGQNTSETSLTPTTVNKTGFGKICSYAVDGQVYAQPLVVTGLAIGSGHPVEYVVTMNDKVYAFDGTNCTLLLGPKSLLQGSEIAAQCGDVGGGGCLTFKPTIGILGTPVIDPGTNIMYLVAWSEITGSPNTFVHRIHALDITNLNEVANGPVAISATVGSASFTSSDHIQRPGLLLLSGSPSVVYVAFSMMDGAPGLPKGWVLGYNASNLTDTNYPLKFPTTPNGSGGGVWQGGAGLAAGKDSSGTTYIYFGTGNGTFDQNVGHTACVDCGDSFVKLTTGTPTVANFFAPFDAFCRNACNADVDFGSGGVTLIPDNTLPSPYAYLAVMADKSKSIWVMGRTSPDDSVAPTVAVARRRPAAAPTQTWRRFRAATNITTPLHTGTRGSTTRPSTNPSPATKWQVNAPLGICTAPRSAFPAPASPPVRASPSPMVSRLRSQLAVARAASCGRSGKTATQAAAVRPFFTRFRPIFRLISSIARCVPTTLTH